MLFNNKLMIVVLGTAHTGATPGKRSPDGKFREPIFSRQVVNEIKKELEKHNIQVFIDYESLEPNDSMKGKNASQEQSRELSWRVNYVNSLCNKYGTNNCIYVSVHVNAAGMGKDWMSARGWSIYTSPGKTKSDILATCIFEEAKSTLPKDSKYYVRADYKDGDPDYEANFYVLTKTKCPAVLTENLFQDNKEDVKFLTSEEGRKKIVNIHVNGILRYINL